MTTPLHRQTEPLPPTGAGPEAPLTQNGQEFNRAEAAFRWALFALVVIRAWIIPCRSSLWLDETATYWVVKDGLADVIHRSWYWSGQSPFFYVIAWASVRVGGHNEWALRLPSVVAMTFAAWLLYRLGRRLFDAETGVIAAIALASFEPAAYAAADARPYALATLCVVAATLALVWWLDTGRKIGFVVYVLLSALTIYAHYLFALALPAHAIYARCHRGAPVLKLLAAWLTAGMLTLPLAPQFLEFYRTGAEHSTIGTPRVQDLLASLVPFDLFVSLALVAGIAWFTHQRCSIRVAQRGTRSLFVTAWVIFPPAACFLISTFTDAKVFVSRYFLAYAGGIAVLVACLVRSIKPIGIRRAIVLAMIARPFLLTSAAHSSDQWRPAMETVRRAAGGANVPVLVASGFVEGTPNRLSDPRYSEVLFAPQVMYPPAGTMVKLPVNFTPAWTPQLEQIVVTSLLHENRFLLVHLPYNSEFKTWLQGRLWNHGFSAKSLGDFGMVSVIEYERVVAGRD